MEVKLNGKRPTMAVDVGGEVIPVPLTLNRVEFEALGRADDKFEALGAFFGKYLGDVYDELGDDDLIRLFEAWSRARAEIGAPGMGEPSASPLP